MYQQPQRSEQLLSTFFNPVLPIKEKQTLFQLPQENSPIKNAKNIFHIFMLIIWLILSFIMFASVLFHLKKKAIKLKQAEPNHSRNSSEHVSQKKTIDKKIDPLIKNDSSNEKNTDEKENLLPSKTKKIKREPKKHYTEQDTIIEKIGERHRNDCYPIQSPKNKNTMPKNTLFNNPLINQKPLPSPRQIPDNNNHRLVELSLEEALALNKKSILLLLTNQPPVIKSLETLAQRLSFMYYLRQLAITLCPLYQNKRATSFRNVTSHYGQLLNIEMVIAIQEILRASSSQKISNDELDALLALFCKENTPDEVITQQIQKKETPAIDVIHQWIIHLIPLILLLNGQQSMSTQQQTIFKNAINELFLIIGETISTEKREALKLITRPTTMISLLIERCSNFRTAELHGAFTSSDDRKIYFKNRINLCQRIFGIEYKGLNLSEFNHEDHIKQYQQQLSTPVDEWTTDALAYPKIKNIDTHTSSTGATSTNGIFGPSSTTAPSQNNNAVLSVKAP